jgi:hypothetical protein
MNRYLRNTNIGPATQGAVIDGTRRYALLIYMSSKIVVILWNLRKSWVAVKMRSSPNETIRLTPLSDILKRRPIDGGPENEILQLHVKRRANRRLVAKPNPPA